MTDDAQPSCSLSGEQLALRLSAIAALSGERLGCEREAAGDWLLRFRKSAALRLRLEQIIAAESRCCSFLELSLSEEPELVLLRIAAPEDGRWIADQLAAAFSPVDSRERKATIPPPPRGPA